MKTLRERQDEFIAGMELFDNWTDRFNYLISESESLPAECPEYLSKFRIDGCISKTCFKSEVKGSLFVSGWSNSAVMGGIIVAIYKIFNFLDPKEYQQAEIDFHIKSGLTDNLTLMRRAALEEMIRRITVLLHRIENYELSKMSVW